MTLKTCAKCGENKDVSEYHRDAQKKDGLRSWCKSCIRVQSVSYRQRNKDTLRRKGRRWRLENRDKTDEYARKYRESNEDKVRSRKREWREKNKDKTRAHDALNRAIKSGSVPPASSRPCALRLDSLCDEVATDYHHHDYSRPLDVYPVCRPCHKRLHEMEKNNESLPTVA